MAVGKSSLVAFCDTHVGFLVPVAVHICTFYIPRHGAASAVPLSEGYLSLQETACRHRFPPQNLAFYFLSVSMSFSSGLPIRSVLSCPWLPPPCAFHSCPPVS
jgi:hypothetical protein